MWSRDYSPVPLLPLFFSIAADIRNPARDTAETPAIRKNLPYAAASPVMATYPSAQAMLPQTTTSAALGFFTVLTPPAQPFCPIISPIPPLFNSLFPSAAGRDIIQP